MIRIHECGALRLSASRCRAGLLAVTLVGCTMSAVQASDRPDHEHARRAMLAGEILPLHVILARVQPRLDGEIIEIELEREDGRWVYEFKVLRADGRLHEYYVDARDGQLVLVKEKAQKRRR